MEGDDRFGVVQQRRHIDLSGFDIDFINRTAPNDMNPDDFILAIERDDPKLLRRFGLEIQEILEDFWWPKSYILFIHLWQLYLLR
jgi:hypothetical protein